MLAFRCALVIILLQPAIALALSLSQNESTKATQIVEVQPVEQCRQLQTRPCIGLVLGGGGARGSAHVGVLKAISELGIPIDLIVGTSVGAFVGGLYATGHSADHIEMLFNAADWDKGYRDALDRGRIPNRHKRQQDAFPIQLDLGFNGKDIKLPKGWIQGQGMKNLIDSMLGPYPELSSFDQLPIAFRAVAADAESGEQVILDSGDLATALQISMSLPGILRPIERDGRLLVDGGIANNLPVNIAKAMGADIVIAVDIGSPPQTRNNLSSSFAILKQLTNFLTQDNQDYQRSLITRNDVLLRPELDDIGILDFAKMPQGIELGYRAATAQLGSLLQQHHIPAEQAWDQSFNYQHIQLDNIVLHNHTRLSEEYILQRMNLVTGQAYSQQQIQQAVDRMYGQGSIARVTTSINRQIDGTSLHIKVEEKEWGPGYLDFKLSFEDNFRSFSLFEVGASYLYSNLSPYGAEWFTAVEFGTEKRLHSELYWPLKSSGFFLAPSATIEREVDAVTEDGKSLGDSIVTTYSADQAVGYEVNDRFDLRLGLDYEQGEIELPPLLAEVLMKDEPNFKKSALYIEGNYDSLDNPNFPRQGWQASFRGQRAHNEFLELTEYLNQFELEMTAAVSVGRHSLKPLLRIQSTFSKSSPVLLGNYALGGFLNLSGNERNYVTGPHLRFANLVYRYQLAKNNFGAINLPLYLGTSIEAGNVWTKASDASFGDILTSQSVFIGWDSPLGAAYLAYGNSETGNESLYVSLGVDY